MEGLHHGSCNRIDTRLALMFFIFIVLALGMVLVFFLNVRVGSTPIKLREIGAILFGPQGPAEKNYLIIQRIRLPRALASQAGGAALAITGILLQTYFANPIIEPYVLGVSSGSSLFVGFVMLGGFTFGVKRITPVVLFTGAFLGAMLVMAVILFAASRVKGITTLLIIGLMAGYTCSAATSILSAYAEKEQLANFALWNMGSFAGLTWGQIRIMYAVILPLLGLSFLMGKPLNALLLGDPYAQSMGINVKMTRYGIILISSLLVSVTTAFAGPVSFIGLAVPHICRILFRTSDCRILIPAAVFGGGLMAGLCDFAARNIVSPLELPLGAITSIIGAPLVVFLLLRKEKL